ncbi:MAG: uncharacterized membrane protein YheB (UPF0754 family) [Verrucomicrobiales bacterium]|jgi:uncharacterized membrane protein YheB (UPF0754 family)
MNKSLATNLIALAFVGIGYALPASHHLAAPIRVIGLFAISGAITNWLAIHMLFEKVPGLYGSGVVPSRFEEFKQAIHELIMNQFFTKENVEAFFEAQVAEDGKTLDPEPILALVDYERMFTRLVEIAMASPMGGMLGMVGGAKALDPLKEPFKENVRTEISTLVASPKLMEAIQSGMQEGDHATEVTAKVEAIVQRRLDELTPKMVKVIVQDMIQQHLGWLVVWGGVFGGLIGLLTHLFL